MRMNSRVRLVATLASALPTITAVAQVMPPALASPSAPLVFRGVTVIDVRDGRRLPNQTVTVVGNRIRSIRAGDATVVPSRPRVVDARGKYLIPGLWDMHVHTYEHIELSRLLLVAAGVTGIRDAASGLPLATLRRLKRDIVAGRRVGPRLLVSGPAIIEAPAGEASITRPEASAGAFIHVPHALATQAVDSLHAAGADFIKTYYLSNDMRAAVAAEARKLGMLWGGHSLEMTGLETSDLGASFLDHGPWLKPEVCGHGQDTAAASLPACAAAAQHLRRNNTWVAVGGDGLTESSDPPTWQRYTGWRKYTPASFVRRTSAVIPPGTAVAHEPASTAEWAKVMGPDTLANRRISAIARQAGLPMILGTDASTHLGSWAPGLAEHHALVGYVLAGWTPLEVLQMATLNPALALRATDSLGTVEAGKLADLVLLDADPLADIWNTTKIRAVVTNGRYYDRAALDDLLRQAEREAARR